MIKYEIQIMKSTIKRCVVIALVIFAIATCMRMSYNKGFKQGKLDVIYRSFYFELTTFLEMYKMRNYIDENLPDNENQDFISLNGTKTFLSGSLFVYERYKDKIDALYESNHEFAQSNKLEKLNMAREITQDSEGVIFVYPINGFK